ncbi:MULTISPECIES: META domain-containing protein [Arthrospira]|jgi:heat shock protein HslJ|uniref:DUF306 domain-containing protein n=1 Tax=Limnospira platensis NIES-46 TaxID=1236695 RepID=A0A5M3TD51_LIMPL|nr:META domain-containing protein [Arthrospira platensis]AMW27900.1 hypothetical protein AP285_07805 [Arthrospira platensis YZ]KDR54405.1 hypothetical protein APPUASWS_028175 [Arthrospira platensis str. Paraca]MBD2712618.1 META domain-containing protein [Arthrospira platensis FACHB-835]MDF2210829.1 META domain-containing protein [Arthrospira platensis NCB002]MDT9183213.1 META domain-containing protein [Limnospira sp. PMC 289.06]MDT9295962.1 META domain-containing protein [Arthrospira platensi
MLKLSQWKSLMVVATCAIASPLWFANQGIAQSGSVFNQNISEQYIAMNHPIADSSWKLSFWSQADRLVDVVSGSEITLAFDQNGVSGSAGCNRLMAGYKVHDNRLEISGVGGTRMACEEPLMSQEFQFVKALEGVQEFRVNGDNLIMNYQNDSGSGFMVFTKHEQASLDSMLNKPWRLLFWTKSDSMIDVVAHSEVTLEFAENRISGTGGCNRLIGGYEVKDQQLEITTLASTSMACEPELMTQESQFMQALEGVQEFRTNGNNLVMTFQNASGSGIMVFEHDN